MGFQELKPKTEAEWLELRSKVLTATDISVILGLNPWKSVSEMQASKLNIVPFENAYTWLGQVLELVVVKCVNKTLNSDYKLMENGSRSFFVDQELGLGATPDASNGKMLLECKSTKPHNYYRWSEWPPTYYLMQLYVQLLCVGFKKGILAILSTNMTSKDDQFNLPLSILEITRHKYIDRIILAEVNRYWHCLSIGKQYRVDRKQSIVIESYLRCLTKSINTSII